MTNIDIKIRLVMRLNSRLKRLELYLSGNDNVPKFMQSDYNNATFKYVTLKTVLTNLNYINY